MSKRVRSLFTSVPLRVKTQPTQAAALRPTGAVQTPPSSFGAPALHRQPPASASVPIVRVDPLKSSPTGTYSSKLDPQHRLDSIARMESEELDVLVIGLGIVGAGTALDAASRGLKTGALEMNDIASGTSSRSSKLIHGGLRYLKQLDFKLVWEALQERGLLLKTIAPHLVHPVEFIYPLTKRVVERPFAGSGIGLYDVMGSVMGLIKGEKRTVPVHKHLSRSKVLNLLPMLKKNALIGAIKFSDARVDDARYTVAVARTAAKQGAALATDVKVIGFLKEGERVVGVEAVDLQTGRKFNVRAKRVISATGVWAEEVQGLAAGKTQEAAAPKPFQIHASKGIHLVFPIEMWPQKEGMIVPLKDGRVLFFIPDGDKLLVGTTDTEYKLYNKAHPAVTERDIDEVLESTRPLFGELVTQGKMIGSYGGLRPLATGPVQSDGATSTLSREHLIDQSTPGLTVIAGGKFTTYRVMAMDAVNAAVKGLDFEVPASQTETLPLEGAEGFAELMEQPERLAESSGLSRKQIDHLLNRYGGETPKLLAMISKRPELAEILPGTERTLAVEILFGAEEEGIAHLDDALARRTRISIECADRGVAAAEPAARLIAEVQKWSEGQIAEEVARYHARVQAELAANDEPDEVKADQIRMTAPSRPSLPEGA